MNWLHFAWNTYVSRSEPLSLVLFVTRRCNARCGHCFVDFQADAGAELTLQEWGQLTGTLGKSLISVNITGGEPFLRTDLADIVNLIFGNTTARAAIITTNGSLTEEIVNLLRRFSRLGTKSRLKISISIDDFEERHDRNRCMRSSFQKAIESYKTVSASTDPRVFADVALTVTPTNCSRVVEVYEHLKDLGVRQVTPILMREAGAVTMVPGKTEVLEGYLRLSKAIDADRLSTPVAKASHRFTESMRSAKNRIFAAAMSSGEDKNRSGAPCVAGSLFGVVDANGNVFPCEVLGTGWNLGNLRDNNLDFGRVWGSAKANDCRAFVRESRCSCSFECAWSVTVAATPSLALRCLAAGIAGRPWIDRG